VTPKVDKQQALAIYCVKNVKPYELAALADLGTDTEYVPPNELRKYFLALLPESEIAKIMPPDVSWEAVAGSVPKVDGAKIERALERIYDRFPYRVYFLDPKGMKAQFTVRPSVANARWVARIFHRICPEAEQAIATEDLETEIAKNSELRLWWD
jgi:hypothetical protein